MPSKKSDLFLQKFAYENPDEVMVLGASGARQCALLSIFYKPGWAWIDGAPTKKCDGKAAGKGTRQYMRSAWRDPLFMRGEEDIQGFLTNNLVAKVFMQSLTQTLHMARRPIKEANEIVRRAAEKMYPDYALRMKAVSKMASEAVAKKSSPCNMEMAPPHDDSLLANLPFELDEEWRDLVLEALELPKRVIEQHGSKACASVRDTKKWTEKMGKGLKKKAATQR